MGAILLSHAFKKHNERLGPESYEHYTIFYGRCGIKIENENNNDIKIANNSSGNVQPEPRHETAINSNTYSDGVAIGMEETPIIAQLIFRELIVESWI